VDANDCSSVLNRQQSRGDACRKPITDLAAGDRAEGGLARPPGHHGQTHFGEPVEIAQQLEIVSTVLAETEAGIDDDALAGDAARSARADALGEKRADLRHHVAVARPALHRARLSLHVHQAHPASEAATA